VTILKVMKWRTGTRYGLLWLLGSTDCRDRILNGNKDNFWNGRSRTLWTLFWNSWTLRSDDTEKSRLMA
jgi:hypothetical protein